MGAIDQAWPPANQLASLEYAFGPGSEDEFDSCEANGRRRAKVEGMAEMLLRQLERRFGSVPGRRKKQVADATLADLDRWSLRVLDAKSLTAVFD